MSEEETTDIRDLPPARLAEIGQFVVENQVHDNERSEEVSSYERSGITDAYHALQRITDLDDGLPRKKFYFPIVKTLKIQFPTLAAGLNTWRET